MAKELKIIEELYSEGRGEPSADASPGERPGLRMELESLRSTKEALDARPRQRPEQGTIDAILGAAAGSPIDAGSRRESTRRRDRAPHPRRSVRLRSAGVATTAVIVLIGIVTVWRADVFNLQSSTQDVELTAAAKQEMDEQASRPAGDRELSVGDEISGTASNDRARPPAPGDRAGSSAVADEMGTPSAADPAGLIVVDPTEPRHDVLSWDQGNEIVEVSQHIEMIRGGVALGWDPPSVPLEMVPVSRQGGAPPSSLQPAGQPRIR